MNVIICYILKKKFLTRIKKLQDLFMNVLNAEIWKKQRKVMNGIIVSINKIMETDRMKGEVYSNLQLIKSALKILHYKEEMILNVQIQYFVEVHRQLHSVILQKIDLI